MESETEKLKRMLKSLIDAHYGLSFNLIGDIDGMTEEEAKEIRQWAKDEHEKELQRTVESIHP